MKKENERTREREKTSDPTSKQENERWGDKRDEETQEDEEKM